MKHQKPQPLPVIDLTASLPSVLRQLRQAAKHSGQTHSDLARWRRGMSRTTLIRFLLGYSPVLIEHAIIFLKSIGFKSISPRKSSSQKTRPKKKKSHVRTKRPRRGR